MTVVQDHEYPVINHTVRGAVLKDLRESERREYETLSEIGWLMAWADCDEIMRRLNELETVSFVRGNKHGRR